MNHENNFPNTYFYHRITLLRVLITTRSFHAFAVYQSRKIFSKIFPLSIFLDASFFFLNRQSISISQSRSTKSPSTFPLAYHFPSETHSLFSLSLSLSTAMEEARKKRSERMKVVQATQGIKRERDPPSFLDSNDEKAKNEGRTSGGKENGDEKRNTAASGSRRFQ